MILSKGQINFKSMYVFIYLQVRAVPQFVDSSVLLCSNIFTIITSLCIVVYQQHCILTHELTRHTHSCQIKSTVKTTTTTTTTTTSLRSQHNTYTSLSPLTVSFPMQAWTIIFDEETSDKNVLIRIPINSIKE